MRPASHGRWLPRWRAHDLSQSASGCRTYRPPRSSCLSCSVRAESSYRRSAARKTGTFRFGQQLTVVEPSPSEIIGKFDIARLQKPGEWRGERYGRTEPASTNERGLGVAEIVREDLLHVIELQPVIARNVLR